MPGGRDEGLADAAPFRRADRDVLQVGILRRQPPGGGHRLVVAGVHAARLRIDLLGQLVRVGRLELREAAVFENQLRQPIRFSQLFEHVLGRRGLPGGRLAQHRQLHLLEQDVAQLLRRIQIERSAGLLVRIGQDLHQAFRQLGALHAQHLAVQQHAVMFHAQQHRDQRLLDFFVQFRQRRYAAELRPQHLVQPQRDVGVFGRIFGRLVHRHLAEGDLLRAFAGDVLVVNRLDAEILRGRRIHVVADGHAVPHVGFEHRVEAHAAQRDAVIGEHVCVVLQVVADLGMLLGLQQRLEARQAGVAIELVRGAGIVVAQR